MLKCFNAFFGIGLLMASGSLSAQEIVVQHTQADWEGEERPAYTVKIPATERRPIKRQWKRRLKDFDNEDVDKSRKEVIGYKVQIPEVSEFPLNVYTKLSDEDDAVKLVVFYQLSDNAFLKPDHPNIEAAKEVIRQFALTRDQMADEQEALSDLEERREELRETIESCKETIKESEKELKSTEKAQKTQKEALQEDRSKVEKLEDRLDNLD